MRLSTTSLKALTGGALVLCAAFLVGWPVILGPNPGKKAPIGEAKAYAIHFVEYVGLIVLLLVLASVGAILILRRAADEYRAQKLENIKDLVEGTLKDKQAKAE